MTVAQLLGGVSSAELVEWMVVYNEQDAATAEAAGGPVTARDGTPLTTPDGRKLNLRGTGVPG